MSQRDAGGKWDRPRLVNDNGDVVVPIPEGIPSAGEVPERSLVPRLVSEPLWFRLVSQIPAFIMGGIVGALVALGAVGTYLPQCFR